MNTLSPIVISSLLGLAILEIYFTVNFIRSFQQDEGDVYQEEELPEVAIVLCLRGADPFLPKCLEALSNQNYPNYRLKVVIDSKQDPAWNITTKILARTNFAVDIKPLQVQRETCSLKCSALIQAISELDSNCEIVALVDADTVPHPNWLRELVSPLKNRQIGLTTGNRWYASGNRWGTTCRYLWNIAAVGQMYFYRIPWGGSLAMRTELIREAKLLERWEQAFCEDTMLQRVLVEKGLRVKSVASLIMVNREECALPNFRRWVSRQLLNAKLYHPGWKAILTYGTITCLIPLLAAVLTSTALLAREWTLAILLGSSLLIYFAILLILIGIWQRAIQHKLMLRNESLPFFSIKTFGKLMVALPLTQLICAIALWQALLTQQVEWRGITYRVQGPWDIKLLEYFPYQYLHRTNPKTSL